jgi:hypothetical protein
MKSIIAAAAAAEGLLVSASGAPARSILHDPVALSIGINCQWQSRCIKLQRQAMKHSLSYVAHAHLPHWKVQLCNRNAARGGDRVDWVGFDHCIRNSALKRPSRTSRRHR